MTYTDTESTSYLWYKYHRVWLIQHDITGEFWDRYYHRWGSIESAALYSALERRETKAPSNGEWVHVRTVRHQYQGYPN